MLLDLILSWAEVKADQLKDVKVCGQNSDSVRSGFNSIVLDYEVGGSGKTCRKRGNLLHADGESTADQSIRLSAFDYWRLGLRGLR